MEDRDPGQLPGIFSVFDTFTGANGILAGQAFGFPAVLPGMTSAERAALHSASLIHEGDGEPVRVFADGDVTDMILSVPKQARIGAGRDIVNMMFFGQNMAESDLTRIIAGRDIRSEKRREGEECVRP